MCLNMPTWKSILYHLDNPYLAILSPESCMIQWLMTHSLDAADWHIDYPIPPLLHHSVVTEAVVQQGSAPLKCGQHCMLWFPDHRMAENAENGCIQDNIGRLLHAFKVTNELTKKA